MLSILQGMLESRISSSVIMTPRIIAQDMIDILPNEVWNKDTTFLDPVCKSGIFLKLIYTRLMIELADEIASEEDRREHILTNQLYGICESKFLGAVSQRTVYNKMVDSGSGNIRYIEGINNIIKRGYEKYKNTIDKEFKRNMRFDVVIGNPPYNKGMDLDFVNKGFEIANKYVVMITPAKWQTAADDQRVASNTIDYTEFRKQLVPHMSKVVFYPDALDVFDIGIREGITYYLLDKSNHNECTVINRCKLQKHFNSERKRSLINRETLHNCGNDIIEHIKNYDRFRFKINSSGKYLVYTCGDITIGGRSGSEYFLLNSSGSSVYLGNSYIVDTSVKDIKLRLPAVNKLSFRSDTKAECESFVSWLNTKFTRFFIAINLSSRGGVITDDYFRFVPAPPSGKFDHIYTDEELYKAFNLPQKYIDVIEAVIKERT